MKIRIISFAVFVSGLCSIVYELLISASATYFLGDGVRQFSLLIGIYLFSMGIGAYVTKFFTKKPISFFIHLEYLLGFIGGISVPLIYYLFITVSTSALQYYCLLIMFCIGTLTGMEVPLLTFASNADEKDETLSRVLSLDYIGGLFATLLFPFILLPFVGLFYSSLIFGAVNILLGIWLNIVLKRSQLRSLMYGIIGILILVILGIFGGSILKVWEEKIYKSPIVLNEQSEYQKIVVTKNSENDVRLFLNRAILFSSMDEYRYHELLVHIPLSLHPNPKKILVLGGGENLASREILKHPNIESIDVIDIDTTIFILSQTNKDIIEVNDSAAYNPKVTLIAQDAFVYLNQNPKLYDVIISDLPDPSNDAISRLYSKQFFMLAKNRLNDDGLFVSQSGEVYYSNTAFNCIVNTAKEVFDNVKAYHTYIPSFGDWGFTIASKKVFDINSKRELPPNLKYLDDNYFAQSFIFPPDIPFKQTKINTLDNPIILNYFLSDWEKWKTQMQTN